MSLRSPRLSVTVPSVPLRSSPSSPRSNGSSSLSPRMSGSAASPRTLVSPRNSNSGSVSPRGGISPFFATAGTVRPVSPVISTARPVSPIAPTMTVRPLSPISPSAQSMTSLSSLASSKSLSTHTPTSFNSNGSVNSYRSSNDSTRSSPLLSPASSAGSATYNAPVPFPAVSLQPVPSVAPVPSIASSVAPVPFTLPSVVPSVRPLSPLAPVRPPSPLAPSLGQASVAPSLGQPFTGFNRTLAPAPSLAPVRPSSPSAGGLTQPISPLLGASVVPSVGAPRQLAPIQPLGVLGGGRAVSPPPQPLAGGFNGFGGIRAVSPRTVIGGVPGISPIGGIRPVGAPAPSTSLLQISPAGATGAGLTISNAGRSIQLDSSKLQPTGRGSYTVKELREFLGLLGADKKGKKAELVARLNQLASGVPATGMPVSPGGMRTVTTSTAPPSSGSLLTMSPNLVQARGPAGTTTVDVNRIVEGRKTGSYGRDELKNFLKMIGGDYTGNKPALAQRLRAATQGAGLQAGLAQPVASIVPSIPAPVQAPSGRLDLAAAVTQPSLYRPAGTVASLSQVQQAVMPGGGDARGEVYVINSVNGVPVGVYISLF